jgi:DNA-binding Lrp family transcriptional regulator
MTEYSAEQIAKLQESAKRHMWLHFTRMSSYADADMPVIVRGSGEYVFDQHGKRYLDGLAGLPEIDYVVITAGSFDLLIEVVCENDDQLLEILARVRSIPSVTMTESFVYLKLCKQTYSWGTR